MVSKENTTLNKINEHGTIIVCIIVRIIKTTESRIIKN